MIKPNELRLGNYVAVKNHGNKVIGKVFAINKDTVSVEDGNNNYDYHLLEPISLTELMLLKCGFEETQLFEDDLVFLFLNGFGLRIDYFEDAFYFDDTKIEYVHQLMNLYFALTGEELEVKV